MKNSVWINCRLKENTIFRHRVGPLTLFLKKVLNEIWVASSRDELYDGDPQEHPEEPDWERMALPKEYNEFQISPAFPNRPVVVDTEYSYRIFNDTTARVYCRIPAFVRITPKSKPDLVISEIPTVILSNTWFGIFTEGELAYALSSTARRVLHEDLFEPHLIMCPIEIQNTSEDELRFEKICLRVDRMSIYLMEQALWADETRIMHHGKENLSEIEMKGVVPPEAKGATLITKPGSRINKSMAVRTFKMLRQLNVPGF